MSTSDRYHHGDLRNALVDAAAQIAAEGDPEALTLRATARRAGVSHAAAYRHFADKRELLQALALRGFAALAAQLDAVFERGEVPAVADIAAAYVGFACDHRVEFRLMFDRSLCRTDGGADPLAEAGLQAQRGLQEVLAARHGVPGDRLADTALAVWSQAHGLATLILETPALAVVDRAEAETLARRCAALIALPEVNTP